MRLRWRWWYYPLVMLAPVVVIGTLLLIGYPQYRRDKAACEERGRFYWRGHCLPSECSVCEP